MTLTYESVQAGLPFLIAAVFALCAYMWAQIADDGKRADRQRFADDALTGLGWDRESGTRYVPGRSAQATPTEFLPRFLPEPDPAEVGVDDDDTGELPAEPTPAPNATVREWPIPEVLPQPRPTALPVLFEATGPYPVLDDEAVSSDITIGFRRLTDAYIAELQAAGIGAR